MFLLCLGSKKLRAASEDDSKFSGDDESANEVECIGHTTGNSFDYPAESVVRDRKAFEKALAKSAASHAVAVMYGDNRKGQKTCKSIKARAASKGNEENIYRKRITPHDIFEIADGIDAKIEGVNERTDAVTRLVNAVVPQVPSNILRVSSKVNTPPVSPARAKRAANLDEISFNVLLNSKIVKM